MLTKYKWLIAVAALIGAAWFIFSPRIELQSQRADRAEQDLQKAEQLIEVQAAVLAGQQEEISRIAEIGRRVQALQQQVGTNARNQSREFEELKRHDETIAEYLGLSVPSGLGMLYARQETTDTAAYRTPAAVQPDTVPAPGPSAPDSE